MSRPRVLFVGPTRYSVPLARGLLRKWSALERQLDYRVLARPAPGTDSDPRFELVGDFYGTLPLRVRHAIRDFQPHAIVAEDLRTASLVMSGRALARGARPRVIAKVHGNWRHSTRLYGSRARRHDVDGLATALVRVLSERTLAERLGRSAHDFFPAWNQSAGQFADRMRALVDAALDLS